MRSRPPAIAYPFLLFTGSLFLVIVTGSPSWSGFALTLGLLLLALSLFVERHTRTVALAGFVVFAGALLVRTLTGNAGRDLRMATPQADHARMVNRLLDERDLAITAARTLGMLHDAAWLRGYVPFASDADAGGIAEAMRAGYDRLHADEGDVPSPVAATYLGLETNGAEDVIEIGDPVRSSTTVIFLHGYAGSFTLPCWEVSRAATRAGMATVCPSIGWHGDWWSREGEAVLKHVVSGLRERGASRFILAGLSNGGAGATQLALRMPGVFSGVLAISGVSHAASPNIPVLVIQGEKDTMASAATAKEYAARAHGQYVGLKAGHFALLMRNEEAMDAMAAWLIRNAGKP